MKKKKYLKQTWATYRCDDKIIEYHINFLNVFRNHLRWRVVSYWPFTVSLFIVIIYFFYIFICVVCVFFGCVLLLFFVRSVRIDAPGPSIVGNLSNVGILLVNAAWSNDDYDLACAMLHLPVEEKRYMLVWGMRNRKINILLYCAWWALDHSFHSDINAVTEIIFAKAVDRDTEDIAAVQHHFMMCVRCFFIYFFFLCRRSWLFVCLFVLSCCCCCCWKCAITFYGLWLTNQYMLFFRVLIFFYGLCGPVTASCFACCYARLQATLISRGIRNSPGNVNDRIVISLQLELLLEDLIYLLNKNDLREYYYSLVGNRFHRCMLWNLLNSKKYPSVLLCCHFDL